MNERKQTWKINEVMRTYDYSKFKHLTGNRSIDYPRVKKVIDSIHEVGYIQCPIIVNEKMEIIDGQARLEALKNLSLPVDYIVVKGAGIAECISMNIKQSNWKTKDFIDCYADIGNINYKYLKILYETYYKDTTLVPITYAVMNRNRYNIISEINGGDFICTEKMYSNAVKILDYIRDFIPLLVAGQCGKKDLYLIALAFCFKLKEVDNKLLKEKFQKYRVEILPVATIEQAFQVIERIYNMRSRKKVFIYTEYLKDKELKMQEARKKYNTKQEDK